jgi:hypothetical protein
MFKAKTTVGTLENYPGRGRGTTITIIESKIVFILLSSKIEDPRSKSTLPSLIESRLPVCVIMMACLNVKVISVDYSESKFNV